jgi:hypothetical protein
MNVVSQIACLIGVICSVIMGISRRGSDYIVKLLGIYLVAGFNVKASGPTRAEHDVMGTIPLNVAEALSKFNLEGRTVTYACCPQCLQTYKPEFKRGSTIPIYPSSCNNRPEPDSPICGEALLETRDDGTGTKPIKPFVYHSFHDYLGMLLSRKDLEGKMDNACSGLLDTLKNPSTTVNDVFEAKFMRTFEGPVVSCLLMARVKGDMHLVLMLTSSTSILTESEVPILHVVLLL